MTVAVVAEKPSVGRDLARVLGASSPCPGGLEGEGWIVTWLAGHVAELAEPGAIHPEWGTWRLEDLPLLPRAIPWRATERGRVRLEAVRAILGRPEVERVVAATDAGREGELIFRVLAELVGLDKPVERLWIASMTDDAIRAGFARLVPQRRFDGWAAAARGRAWADWWVGINASRALTLTHGEPLTAGRVQTPTLALVVARDRAIDGHVPERFASMEARARGRNAHGSFAVHLARGPDPFEPEAARFDPEDPVLARALAEIDAYVEARTTSSVVIPPPPLHDLDLLQQDAHTALGLSAHRTLALAQLLYERHKLLSYPRTDSRKLDPDTARTLADRLAASRLDPTGVGPLDLERHVAPADVRDHHAILPTGAQVPSGLDPAAAALYALVERRLLAAHALPARVVWERVILSGSAGRWVGEGSRVEVEGWTAVEPGGRPSAPELPPGLAEGVVVELEAIRRVDRVTEPPPRLDDGRLVAAMVEAGLGTPATRAETIESLIERGYLERSPTSEGLVSTDLGRRLAAVAPPALAEPELTRSIEAALGEIAKGGLGLDAFVDRVHRFVADLVDRIVRSARAEEGDLAEDPRRAAVRTEPEVPLPSAKPRPGEAWPGVSPALDEVLREGAWPETWARLAEARGDAVVSLGSPWLLTRAALLAGRTGSGPTLVLTALPEALLDDEVMQLRALELGADRLHPGRSDGGARATARAWLDRALDVLFVDPVLLERPRMAPFLEKGRPGVVVVDEVDRVSLDHPDPLPRSSVARLRAILDELRRASPELRRVGIAAAAPASALDDALERLGWPSATRVLEPWRSTGLALEVVEVEERRRTHALRSLLSRTSGTALVLTRTADRAEALGAALEAEVVHAGRPPDERARSVVGLVEGRIRRLVATSALSERLGIPGLGLLAFDGLPGGLWTFTRWVLGPAVLEDEVRAVLLLEPRDLEREGEQVDRRVPEVEALALLARELGPSPIPLSALASAVGMDRGWVARHLRPLVEAEGVVIEPSGARIQDGGWRARHRTRRARALAGHEALERWTSDLGCRLEALAQAAGRPPGGPCGLCDGCDPDGTALRRSRPPTESEARVLQDILQILARGGPLPQGQLLRAVQGERVAGRAELRRLLASLRGAGLVQARDEAFEKAGETRRFVQVSLTPLGRDPSALRLVRLPEAQVWKV